MMLTKYTVIASVDAGNLGTVTRTVKTEWWIVAQLARLLLWLTAPGHAPRVCVYVRGAQR